MLYFSVRASQTRGWREGVRYATTPTDITYIERDPEVYGGKPCVAGHRTAVHDVAVLHRQGPPPESIAARFHLAPVQIYAALTYYYDHQEAIDREIAEEDADIAAHTRADQSPLDQRIW